MLESRRGERSRLAGIAVVRHSSQEAADGTESTYCQAGLLRSSTPEIRPFWGCAREFSADACRKFRPNREVATAFGLWKAYRQDENIRDRDSAKGAQNGRISCIEDLSNPA